ncbi:serine carboxypeptidase-like 51 [Phtheirospermum japonicum]|uniref:Carboxypeptidase n=1 Tax=Phtheirospermum japonicum TaxID=374723 RepID=A0A830BLA1_9LAMI|nr:serine carboxypeptidase-like 51 [Phtheirospermum japonicum]
MRSNKISMRSKSSGISDGMWARVKNEKYKGDLTEKMDQKNGDMLKLGLGSSGVGIGNFQEIGPLDANLKTRDSTWLKKADLLFVDSPVGTGYSYVENASLLVKRDEEAAADLTTLLIDVYNRNESLQKSPLYIVGESYGGKHVVTLGL